MFWRRRSRELDLERELRAHLELEAEEQGEDGLSPDEARYAAQRTFGNTALVMERVRDTWGLGWLHDALQDFRFAVRMLGRNRGFAAGAVVPLAFAIGCAACALTLVDAVLFRPLGMKAPDRMAAVYAFSRQRNAFVSSSYPDFRDVQSLGSIVESAAAFVRIPVNVRLAEGTERMNSEMVTADYFRTAGVAPILGRPLGPGDLSPGAPPVTLVSYSFWENRYRRSTSILGSVAWIDGVAFTIVGVMPRGYAGSLLDWNSNPSFWIPLTQIRQMVAPFRSLDYENLRDMQWLMTIARLRPGAGLAQLQTAADTLAKRATERRDVSFVVLAANRARFFPGHRAGTIRILWVLVMVAAAALAIACFNLAGLLLARAAARQKEIGVRLALGAGRCRLLQQFIIENAVLAGCACALGLPMAVGITNSARAFENAFGLSLNLSPDARALAISALAGLATAVLAGLTVAWKSSRMHLANAMKDALLQPSGRAARVSLRDLFVAAQVACAMVTLVTAALLGQSLWRWAAIPLGYAPHGILVGTFDALSARLPAGEKERIYRTLLEEVRSETRGAALAAQAMPAGVRTRIDVAADGSAGRWTTIDSNDVSDGYFELLRIPVVRGRSVLPGDDSQSRPVVVLNQTAAALFWPGQNPIGRRLRIRGEASDREVAGVVADARYRPLGETESPLPFAFLPIFQHLPQVAAIHARTPGEPKNFVAALRRIVGRVVRDMPLSEVQPLDERVESGLSQVRLVSQAVGIVCAVGVGLALAGILASGAYRIVQRKREIAIRIAIGAEPGRLIRSFAARGAAIGLAGAAAGLFPAAWASSLLRSSLGGVDAPGPFLFGISAVALAVVTGAASWAVARRIALVQPADILRVQ
jgi:predicted permease